jgi:hypothetical protein
MTEFVGAEKPSLDELAHVGVKGMKWGKHRQRRLDRVTRVASGKGSVIDKARVFGTEVSAASAKRNKGFQGAVASRQRELEGRKKRIESGQATVKDFLALHGGDKWITGKH